MFCGLTMRAGKVAAFDFEPSSGRLDETTIFDSAWASPGRYVHEICRRMIAHEPNADRLIVANPVLPVKSSTLVDWLALAPSAPVAFVDRGGFPLAYVLPRRIFDDGLERFLPFLSMVDSDIDGRFLAALTGREAKQIRLDIPPVTLDDKFAATGSFAAYKDKVMAWTEQCRAAVRLMERSADWKNLPTAIYMPFAAGDVLFAGLASHHVTTPLYRKIVVCDRFQDIWAETGSPMEMVSVPWSEVNTNGNTSLEGVMFARQAQKIGKDVGHFVAFGPGSRIYDRGPFHLFDQHRFALGESLSSVDDLFYFKPTVPLRRCELPLRPRRVLLCQRGSWSLKTYPDRHTRVLTHVLRSLDIEVSVLNPAGTPAEGVAVVRSDSTAELRSLLDDHHVFVSADTFDLHFARHVVGHPTVALFGSTWPGNSDSVRLPESRILCGPLACTPCGVTDRCPLTRGSECANYPPPHEVVAAVLDVFDRVYAA
ncbi:hypothetical protein RA307_05725 [Xanthobacteraceae bacterium Astr-EGSB]|uniref:glycosyltransferase family 9 protein n=1 Tax=Astrobacterium formosum TaxID=3069710 RepID=UPI0027B229C4|nr:hypothetical protein [Xanthobacteraceae bacterium Astr-EGSB]